MTEKLIVVTNEPTKEEKELIIEQLKDFLENQYSQKGEKTNE